MVRRSAKLTEARKKARERAAAQIEREESLLNLAEKFIVAEEELSTIDDSLQDQIRKIDERAERERDRAREAAETNGEDLRSTQASVADEMVELGAKPADVAARLGISVSELRKLRSNKSSKDKSEAESAEQSSPTPNDSGPSPYVAEQPVSVSA